MQGTTLRELARAFAKGELGRDQYRRDRSKLVSAIVAGEIAVKNIDFPPPIKPPGSSGAEATEPRPRRRRSGPGEEPEATTQITPATARPRSKPASPEVSKATTGPVPKVVVIVAALGIAAAAAWYFGSRPASGTAPGAATPAADAAPQAAPATTVPEAAEVVEDPRAEAGRALISQFLQDRNWSDPSLASFQSAWSALDPEQRTAALASADAGRLASAIYQRLLEERAVSGLGDAEASLAKQRELVGFAAAVGLADARLSLPEPSAEQSESAPLPDAATTD